MAMETHARAGRQRSVLRLGEERPAWMPHPALVAFILVLWTLAAAAQAPHWLGH
jgi:hypothetical protein